VAAGASLNIKDLVDDPQLKARHFFFESEHPVGGRLTLPGLPWRPADGMVGYPPAPLLGEHNYGVFGGLLGLTVAEIDRLIAEEVIK
jgi:crotonobetainyl-CoA:carnitine CoA-transferase CaiB-like acyl-CoA transferase